MKDMSAGRLMALALLALVPSPQASAVTVTNLRNMHLDALFGRYAPAGDCKREPRITVDATGFTFTNGKRTVHPARFEHAVSYGPHDYAGISAWFFPFMKNDNDYGPVLMTFNANEKRGVLMIENERAGAANPLYAALAKGSPYRKCAAPRP
jgi:hypothetical protein